MFVHALHNYGHQQSYGMMRTACDWFVYVCITAYAIRTDGLCAKKKEGMPCELANSHRIPCTTNVALDSTQRDFEDRFSFLLAFKTSNNGFFGFSLGICLVCLTFSTCHI